MASRSAAAPFRRAILRVHLWTGLAAGLYIAMLSVTGSALVYRLELNRLFATPTPAFSPGREPLAAELVAGAARRAYPEYLVTVVGTRVTHHRPAIEVSLERGTDRRQRLFDPYTGADLGDAMSPVMRGLTWLASLHNDLLLGRTGRAINGIGSLAVALLVVTGLIAWWPQSGSWRRHLRVDWRGGWRSIAADLHRAIGFCGAGLVAVWAVSGVYLSIPTPFERIIDAVSDPDALFGERPGDLALERLTWLHFGRFSASAQILWVVLGLVPAALVVTGGLMWWIRRFGRPVARPGQDDRGKPQKGDSGVRRMARPGTAVLAVLIAGGGFYRFANYREEAVAQWFLDAVAAGRYDDAYTMWQEDPGYDMRRFLDEWGPGGRIAVAGLHVTVVDSNTGGADVTVYVAAGRAAPLALQVDKETQRLSHALYNKYAPGPRDTSDPDAGERPGE